MDVLRIIREDRVVAVIRATTVPDPADLTAAIARGGIRAVEFTFTIPNAADTIRAASASGALVGAGTVLNGHQAEIAIEAGARFLVSPTVVPELLEVAGDIPVVLGAFTPTEIQTAVDAGAAAVKVFPARVGGPSYLRDLAGPFPHLSLMPSGGVNPANAREFLDAGAMAVYAGSSLAPPALVEAGDHEEIHRRAKAYAEAVR